MRRRLLSAVMALSLLAMVFTAVPTSAGVYYTGSIETTDNTGELKDTYVRGERVYVSVELDYMGEPAVEEIVIRLVEADGGIYQSIPVMTDNPENGSYDSWLPPAMWLNTNGISIYGEFAVVDVVAYVLSGMVEFARTQITVVEEGLFLDPPPAASIYWDYYPGQEVTVTLVTTHTEDFYIQVVNDTFEDFLNWTNKEAADNYWSDVWTVPDDIPDGWYTLNVRAELDDVIWYSTSFQIQAFILEVDSDRENYLPGEVAEVNYRVVDIAALDISAAVTIEWNMTYTNESGNETYLWGTFAGASGVEPFEIPTDIALYGWVELHFYANDTQDRSAESWLFLDVGLMSVEADLDEGPYAPGETVEMEAWAYCVSQWPDQWDPLPGADVNITVTKDDVVIGAYGADGLVTNLDGGVYHSFDLAETAGLGTYTVTVTASKLDYSASTMVVFHVNWEADFSVQFDKDSYYSGETVTLSFEAKWNGEEVTGYPILYRVFLDSWTTLLAIGNSNGSDAMVDLPDEYTGDLDVYAEINIDGYVFTDNDDSEVAFATVIVSPLLSYYKPGETVTFVYEILTGIAAGTLEYTVVDGDDTEVAKGDLAFTTSGSFDFAVPDEDASSSYEATLKMQDGTGRVASGSAMVWLYDDFEIKIWLETESKYASGAFRPGDVLTLGYEILVYNEDADVPVFKIYYGTWLDDQSHVMVVTELMGEFEYTVPDHVASTEVDIWASLYDAVNGWWLSEDYVTINTDASLSGWDRSIAGMAAIDFTILLLIVIMILLLIIVPFLKGRMGGPKPAKEKPVEPEPAPPVAPPEQPTQ